MADAPQKNSSFLVILVALGLVVGGAAYFLTQNETNNAVKTAETPAAQEVGAENTQPSVPAATVDVAKALTERVLGNPSAQVKISEHSSLTCPHCAHFHRDTLPKLKADYIDTGKAYIVFSDFPLNAPALKASSLARCMPDDKYFDFIETLFKQQENWAFEENYAGLLKGKAVEAGLDAGMAEACFESKEVQDGLVAALKAAQTQWAINSTPSLVINNQKVISGAAPYEEIAKALDEALGIAPAPAPSVPAADTPSPAEAVPPAAAETPSDAPAAPTTP